LNAPIAEIFSSIQGEGLLIGRRQIFIRFAGCNLNCSYCDTPESRLKSNGTVLTSQEVLTIIENLKTPDVHSIAFTGGEPLLYVDFINEILDKTDLISLLETNGTLPNNLKRLRNITHVSLDIKLQEHFKENWNDEIFENEINSLKILIEQGSNIYCKLVVYPSTKLNTVEKIAFRLSNEIENKVNIPLVIQPVSPINKWDNFNKLFGFSQLAGKYMEVLIIPQTHKFLNIK